MRFLRILMALPLALAAISVPAAAQSQLEPRVSKLESEMRAVQRKVFPGGSDRFFEPDIVPEERARTTIGGAASGPVADLLARVDALEAQLARITAQAEENNYKLGLMEDRLAVLEEASQQRAAAAAAAASPGAETTAAAAAPSAERIEKVAAIVKPQTGDDGADEYVYGFRLWDAGFYPEAQQQLEKVVAQFPNHSRNSFARNLLGRAYLDDGKPGKAAATFLENYQTLPRGDRAPDSLYYLGRSMIARDERTKACVAFDELADSYPEAAEGRLASDIAKGRTDARCS